MKNKYTTPALTRAKGGWYVYFRFNGKLLKFKKNINRIKDLKEREIFANALCSELNNLLKKGWNPLVNQIEEDNELENYSIEPALLFALEKKETKSPKTYSYYKTSIEQIVYCAKKIGYNICPMSSLKISNYENILREGQRLYKWSDATRDRRLTTLINFCNILRKYGILTYNPCDVIDKAYNKNLDDTPLANIPPDDKEMDRIKNHIAKVEPNFLFYLETLYHTGIRPDELLHITLNNIDIEKGIITLKASETKTKKSRQVPINEHLLIKLYNLNLHSFPSDYYLFGSFREKGRGNIGKQDDFIIGCTKLKRDTATKRWNKLVKKQLGIKNNMYSLKHKGADDKIKSGMDIKTVQVLFGHSSTKITEIYARANKEKEFEKVKKISPKF